MMHQEKPKDSKDKNKNTVSPSPIDVLDLSDPGDSTQRAFRYQHGYGVILLVAGASGRQPYKAVWCEHHEDLLCERSDGLFDGYQIKTRKRENGAWTLTDDAVLKSIKRFVQLVDKFKDKIHELFFVSNTESSYPSSTIKKQDDLAKSPRRFFEAIKNADSIEEIQEPFDKSFTKLLNHCECSDELLFTTLKRVDFVKGPELESFDNDIAHEHLPQLDKCKKLNSVSLNQLRDELIQKVFNASSLFCDDPSRHWTGLDRNNISNPVLLSKKLGIEVINECLQTFKDAPFRYAPGFSKLEIKATDGQYSVLKAKLQRGGIGGQFDTMQRRTFSTEQKLLELPYSTDPKDSSRIINQLECVVKAECDEAQLKASLGQSPYGSQMLNDVYNRLKALRENDPAKAEYFLYEDLVGMAGLLTEDCKVWWSEEFDLGATI